MQPPRTHILAAVPAAVAVVTSAACSGEAGVIALTL